MGTKATKIIRIVRLVRMVRVVKLYRMTGDVDELRRDDSSLEPSSVGKKLTERQTVRLISMMLSMILVLPWLYTDSLLDNAHNFQHDFLKHLHQYPQAYNHSGRISVDDFREQVRFYGRESYELGYPLAYLEVCEPQPATGTWSSCRSNGHESVYEHSELRSWLTEGDQKWSSLVTNPVNGLDKPGVSGARRRARNVLLKRLKHRDMEYFVASVVGCYNASAQVIDGFLTREPTKISESTAGGALGRGARCDVHGKCSKPAEKFEAYKEKMEQPTCVSTAAFSLRSQTRLLAGLQLVKTFVIMLLIVGGSVAFNADAQVYVIGPIERMMALVEKLSENPLGATHLDLTYDDDKKVRDQGYETVLLEQTLERVGELLQVGFGAAGAEIIGKNMAVHSSLNPMVPGKKITAIYGFCDIRRFTDTTECLQEDVMAYVNRLGSLVHGSAHSYFGAANKNVGDAFLVSWKLCDGKLSGFSSFDDEASEEQRLKANSLVKCSIGKGRKATPSQLADAAICSFLRCQLDLEEANREGELREYSQRPSVQQRFGDAFAVKMGFGMHVGWAVEGAIGSSLKIDATYLSPHVEMSDRLEAASKVFGTPLNLSHWLRNLASPSLAAVTRPVARLKADGVSSPFDVFALDVTDRVSNFGRQFCDAEDSKGDFVDWAHADVLKVQASLHPLFRSTWKQGYEAFLRGDWILARKMFAEAARLKPGDGPAAYLLSVMARFNNEPPAGWDGAHVLDGF